MKVSVRYSIDVRKGQDKGDKEGLDDEAVIKH